MTIKTMPRFFWSFLILLPVASVAIISDKITLEIKPSALVVDEKEVLIRGPVSIGIVPYLGLNTDIKSGCWVHGISTGFAKETVFLDQKLPSDFYKLHYSYSLIQSMGSLGKSGFNRLLGVKIGLITV